MCNPFFPFKQHPVALGMFLFIQSLVWNLWDVGFGYPDAPTNKSVDINKETQVMRKCVSGNVFGAISMFLKGSPYDFMMIESFRFPCHGQ